MQLSDRLFQASLKSIEDVWRNLESDQAMAAHIERFL